MFGRLKPHRHHSTAIDRANFGREYCNLCGAISAEYGYTSRLLSTFDVASLAWLLLDRAEQAHSRSTYNCVRKRPSTISNIQEIDKFLAAMSVYSCAIKTWDDLEDEGRLSSRIASRAYGRAFDRAEKHLLHCGFPLADFQSLLQLQKERESIYETDLDKAAEPTGRAYGIVAEHISRLNGEVTCDSETAEHLGNTIGRYVFLADAFHDYSKDFGKNYNPLIDGSAGSTLSESRRRELFDYLSVIAERMEHRLSSEVGLLSRWDLLRRPLEEQMGLSRESLVLNMICCIPCGDGMVGIDTDGDCCQCIAVICCCSLCFCFSGS